MPSRVSGKFDAPESYRYENGFDIRECQID